MKLHIKTRGPGLCRRHSTHVIMLHTHANKHSTHVIMLHTHVNKHSTHVIMLHTHANKDKTTEARTGLRINKKKTQILRINSKCENRILIDDQELKEVDKYNYLGANVSKQGGGGDDIVN